jgi:Tol biopolymer transport system component
LLVGVILGIAWWSSRPDAPRPLTRFVIDSTSNPLPDRPRATDLAITPDGTRIVYQALVNDRNELVMRALDELEASSLADSGRRGAPFVSPDGKWIGYFAAQALRKVSILGGPPATICELPAGSSRGGSWGDDDSIIFAMSGTSGLMRVPAGGGEPEELTRLQPRQGAHQWPKILPGGEAVLFTIFDGASLSNSQIALLSLDSGEIKIVVSNGAHPRYAPTGHIVYAVGSTLQVVGFDLDELEVTTDPVPVLEAVVPEGSVSSFDISQDGSLVYEAGPADGGGSKRTLVWVDREGNEESLAAEPRAYTYPRISPDGTRLALDVRDQEQDIWIWDFARETLTRLTFDPMADYYPTWTPDGARIAFASGRFINFNLFWKAADGTGSVEQLTEDTTVHLPQAFSRDGATLVFRENSQRGVNLRMRSMDSNDTPEYLLDNEFDEQNAEISRDGNWLAYDSNASGELEIYVRPFPNVDDGLWQISQGGGTQPLWGPDDRELFYVSSTGQLVAVPIEMNPFTPGNPEVVLERSYVSRPGGVAVGRTYDVSPDGKRFLMIKEETQDGETVPTQIILVQNWLDELKRLVPVDH